MRTLDDLLRKTPVRGKHIVIVGPNMSVRDDPSPLYFANRMARDTKGTLTVIDIPPTWHETCHGNIDAYMRDLHAMAGKGVPMKEPRVNIGDVCLSRLHDIDLIYDHETFKCIIHHKYATARGDRKNLHTLSREVIDAYHHMLSPGGSAVFVTPHFPYLAERGEWTPGHKYLSENLLPDKRFDVRFSGPYRDQYRLLNVDASRFNNRGDSTHLRKPQQGTIRVGNNFNSMYAFWARKR